MKNQVIIQGIAYSLSELEKDIWSLLQRGAVKAKDGLHTGVIANQAEYGISMRTVVLRKVSATNRTLLCHTDKRSHKVSEIQAQPEVSWLFYDASRNLQLRLAGKASIHESDALAEEIWKQAGIGSRKIYSATYAPASILDQPDSGLPPSFQGKKLSLADVEGGRANFVVICTQVHFIDWLYLNPEGHVRAQFFYEGEDIHRHWVSP